MKCQKNLFLERSGYTWISLVYLLFYSYAKHKVSVTSPSSISRSVRGTSTSHAYSRYARTSWGDDYYYPRDGDTDLSLVSNGCDCVWVGIVFLWQK